MIINSCTYYFANPDGMLNNDITGAITIQEGGEISASLIKEINDRTIKVILDAYTFLTFKGYEGIINYYGDGINKSATYEYNLYYTDDILRMNDIYTSPFENNTTDEAMELFNKVKKINTVGKTFILNNFIYICDASGVANFRITHYKKSSMFKTEIRSWTSTDNFINVYCEVKNIIGGRGTL